MSHQLGKVVENISIDCVIFGFDKGNLEVLLIQRAINPEKDKWALPGGFILKSEEIENAAARILKETSAIENIYMEQLSVFGNVNRYPDRRVFTIGYFALVSPEKYNLLPGIDTTEVRWFKMSDLPELAFDHKAIIETALKKLRSRVRIRPIGFELLPKKFSLPKLQTLYESILGVNLDKRNFRKKLLKMNLLIKLDEKEKGNIKRAAMLYKFDRKNYNKLVEKGFIFEL
ncbi:MAG: NUDIX hydrolase [Ignavibacteria bacterium]|nr:NUDIX hydrolase [Ignavibacteria bacterium]